MKINNKALYFIIFLSTLALQTATLLFMGAPLVGGDDTWAATSILGNPIDNIMFTLRFDLHPPIYYMFMDLWGIAGKSDVWLRFSSIFLHSLLCCSVFYITQKLFSKTVATLALLLAFSSPLLLEYSISLRMYPLIALLSVWSFYLSHLWHEKEEKKYTKTLFGLNFLLSNAHAVGILFSFFHYCYGVLKSAQNKNYKNLLPWSFLFFFVFILAIPGILNSFTKSVSHATTPQLGTLENIITDTFYHVSFLPTWIAVAISIVITFFLLKNKSTKLAFIAYAILPIIVFSLISAFIKPMWLTRNFVFAVPILSILFGAFTYYIFSFTRQKTLFSILLVGVLAIVNLNTAFTQRAQQDQSGLSALIGEVNSKKLSSNKVCYMTTSTMVNFWQLLRYTYKNDWGNSMKIQPPLTERWQDVVKKLPVNLAQALKLYPEKNHLENGNLIIASGWSERCFKEDISEQYIIASTSELQPFSLDKSKLQEISVFPPFVIFQINNMPESH